MARGMARREAILATLCVLLACKQGKKVEAKNPRTAVFDAMLAHRGQGSPAMSSASPELIADLRAALGPNLEIKGWTGYVEAQGALKNGAGVQVAVSCRRQLGAAESLRDDFTLYFTNTLGERDGANPGGKPVPNGSPMVAKDIAYKTVRFSGRFVPSSEKPVSTAYLLKADPTNRREEVVLFEFTSLELLEGDAAKQVNADWKL